MTHIEELYFNWLCAKVLQHEPHNHNYHVLLEILYRTEFTWSIRGDKNRQEDALELRLYFLNESGLYNDPHWYESPCSLLEFFIAFAQRGSFQTDEPVFDWFWRFMAHLGLDEYRRVAPQDVPVIHQILDRFLNREFDENGNGGILPLHTATRDQRGIELWFQMCDYISDRALI